MKQKEIKLKIFFSYNKFGIEVRKISSLVFIIRTFRINLVFTLREKICQEYL